MKEGGARAVLREAWLRGHRCVELQRDGKRTIFVCTRCGTRCYSDGALVDHLHGNLHARRSAAITANESKNLATILGVSEERTALIASREWESQDENGQQQANASLRNGIVLGGGPQTVWAGPSGIVGPSKTPLEWIGSGELFFGVPSSTPVVVDSCWFSWKGKQSPESSAGQGGGGIIYGVIMFPYSDMIGRGGDWKAPWSSEAKQQLASTNHSTFEAENRLPPQTNSSRAAVSTPGHLSALPTAQSVAEASQLELFEQQQRHGVFSKDASSRVLRHACKRKKAKVVERLCFICHQRMTSGKDVAALLNLHTKQMVCGSRNKRGVFHVYHSSCLIDWISICEVKTFTGQLDHRIDRTRKLTRTRRAIVEQGDGGPLSNAINEGAIFCPECQGTGLKLRGAQLERPRYRLAQVFDWILELIQARKAWTDNPRKQDTSRFGLLFREEMQQPVAGQSRGLLHFYSGCAELLSGTANER